MHDLIKSDSKHIPLIIQLWIFRTYRTVLLLIQSRVFDSVLFTWQSPVPNERRKIKFCFIMWKEMNAYHKWWWWWCATGSRLYKMALLTHIDTSWRAPEIPASVFDKKWNGFPPETLRELVSRQHHIHLMFIAKLKNIEHLYEPCVLFTCSTLCYTTYWSFSTISMVVVASCSETQYILASLMTYVIPVISMSVVPTWCGKVLGQGGQWWWTQLKQGTHTG